MSHINKNKGFIKKRLNAQIKYKEKMLGLHSEGVITKMGNKILNYTIQVIIFLKLRVTF